MNDDKSRFLQFFITFMDVVLVLSVAFAVIADVLYSFGLFS